MNAISIALTLMCIPPRDIHTLLDFARSLKLLSSGPFIGSAKEKVSSLLSPTKSNASGRNTT